MIDYKDFQPAQTGRVRENIEWTVSYHYNVNVEHAPRLLLIGDSICHAYQKDVREELAAEANVSFWAGSKCVTDKDYFRELDMILDYCKYDMICFNNGLHSLKSNQEEYKEAYAAALRFIRAKSPESFLAVVTSTPLVHAENTAKVIELNDIAIPIANAMGLEILDLFTPMDALERDNWCDEYHYKPETVKYQAKIIAEFFRQHISAVAKIEQQSSATGPDGYLA